MPTNLLEIGKLRYFHAIAPDLPTKSPCAKGWAFPIILNKANIMKIHVDTDGIQRAKVKRLQVRRAGFDQHLILIIML